MKKRSFENSLIEFCTTAPIASVELVLGIASGLLTQRKAQFEAQGGAPVKKAAKRRARKPKVVVVAEAAAATA